LDRRALLAMATLRMLPPALGRLHPRFGTPAAAIYANASLVALATLTLRFDDALQLSMLFYCGSAALQCAACARLRSMHPKLPRPSLLLPTPLLGLPCAVACLVLLLAPHRLLATAGAVLAALGGGHAAMSALTVRCAGLRSRRTAARLDRSRSRGLPRGFPSLLDELFRRPGLPPAGRVTGYRRNSYDRVPYSERCATSRMVDSFEMADLSSSATFDGDAFAARVEHELETHRRPLRATVDTPRCSLPPLPCAQLSSRGGSTAAAGGGEEGSRGGDDGEVLPGVLS